MFRGWSDAGMHRSSKIGLSFSKTIFKACFSFSFWLIHAHPLPRHSLFPPFTYITINPRAVHIPYSVLILPKKGPGWVVCGYTALSVHTSFDHGEPECIVTIESLLLSLISYSYPHCM